MVKYGYDSDAMALRAQRSAIGTCR